MYYTLAFERVVQLLVDLWDLLQYVPGDCLAELIEVRNSMLYPSHLLSWHRSKRLVVQRIVVAEAGSLLFVDCWLCVGLQIILRLPRFELMRLTLTYLLLPCRLLELF